MSVTKISIGAQINQAFQPIHEFVTSYNDRDHLPFSNGRTLSKDDCTQLRLILNDAGSKRLWAPFKETDTVVDCLENLDEWLQHTQDLLQDRIEYLKGLPNPPSYEDWTISEVYNKSYQFHQLLSNCVYYGVLGNEAFHPEGSRRRAFEHFSIGHYGGPTLTETLGAFASPGYPHITIITIQPQQGAEGELLYSEFFTLHKWTTKLAYRVRRTKTLNLPIRMVSICNTKARVISADFSYGYLKCIASAEKEAKGQPVSCQIEVGEYYDLADREDLVELTKELAWIPIGNDYLPREKKP